MASSYAQTEVVWTRTIRLEFRGLKPRKWAQACSGNAQATHRILLPKKVQKPNIAFAHGSIQLTMQGSQMWRMLATAKDQSRS